ncbi:MAG: hypothetical protein R3E01_36355 [Pirellulaceae bacterium]|nr:hypothetical protein [Planctomycetales bacterium]
MTDALSEFMGNDFPTAPIEPRAVPHLFVDFITPHRSHAFAYAHLYSVTYDGDIELEFSEHRIRLEGQQLDVLYRGFQQHLVSRVVEVDDLHAQAASITRYVSQITVSGRLEANHA